MKTRISILEDLFGLFYPDLCLICEAHIPSADMLFCFSCQQKLPKTRFYLHAENPFTERFWGRLPLKSGASYLHFSKNGRTQQLIHQLKYNRKKEVGVKIGEDFGLLLKQSPFFQTVDFILPVPLHPAKLRRRGFNQSALFAEGLSKSMEIPYLSDVLIRVLHTQSQTQKTRMARFENVKNAFLVRNPLIIQNKHILLVDDVLTTGATLEACGYKILEIEGTTLSFATIAMAE